MQGMRSVLHQRAGATRRPYPRKRRNVPGASDPRDGLLPIAYARSTSCLRLPDDSSGWKITQKRKYRGNALCQIPNGRLMIIRARSWPSQSPRPPQGYKIPATEDANGWTSPRLWLIRLDRMRHCIPPGRQHTLHLHSPSVHGDHTSATQWSRKNGRHGKGAREEFYAAGVLQCRRQTSTEKLRFSRRGARGPSALLGHTSRRVSVSYADSCRREHCVGGRWRVDYQDCVASL